mgnify:CR=1 FL=1
MRRPKKAPAFIAAYSECGNITQAAEIAGIDPAVVNALADEIHADLEIGDELGTGFLENVRRVANVVVMAVRQQHMGHAVGDLFPAARP